MNQSTEDSPIKPVKTYNYLSNNTYTSMVVVLFWVYILLSAVAIAISAYVITAVNNFGYQEAIDANDVIISRYAIYYYMASGLQTIIYCISSIPFSLWVYRASKNLHALNPQRKFKFSPGWCIGGFYIPIVSLYWPYQAMKELWLASTQDGKETSIILYWWLAFLMAIILQILAGIKDPLNFSQIIINILLDSASIIFGAISAYFAIKIVRVVNKKSQISSRAHQLG